MSESELKLPLIFGKKKPFQKSCMIYDVDCKEVAVCRGESSLGNLDRAETIVTAVNSHQLLVDALEWLAYGDLNHCVTKDKAIQYMRNKARAALEAARGEK